MAVHAFANFVKEKIVKNRIVFTLVAGVFSAVCLLLLSGSIRFEDKADGYHWKSGSNNVFFINPSGVQVTGTSTVSGASTLTGIVTLGAALNGDVEAVTGAETIDAWGASELDGTSAGGAGAALTLGSATVTGTIKTISMQEATTSFTLTVTNHNTTDPEEFLFDAVDEALTLNWTGTEWITLNATGVSTP